MRSTTCKGIAVLAAAAALLLLLLASGPARAQHPHPPTGAAAALQLDNGKPWATDAPLRRGMAEIRKAVTTAPAAAHAGKAKPDAYHALGTRVEKEVARIVAECKLEPRADAQLHLVVADLLAGADTLKAAKHGEGGREGLLQVAGALDAYGKHFKHPGWKPISG